MKFKVGDIVRIKDKNYRRCKHMHTTCVKCFGSDMVKIIDICDADSVVIEDIESRRTLYGGGSRKNHCTIEKSAIRPYLINNWKQETEVKNE